MADLFHKQAMEYSESRPSYPQQLFQFIASHTPIRDLAWDVATGNGQAAVSLAGIYKQVIATDTSQKQLSLAPKLPNVQYKCTPSNMDTTDLEAYIAPESTVDLVTVAQGLHWFHLPSLYQQAKRVLKKPHGVFAAWCYTIPSVNPSVDSVFVPFYAIDSQPYWDAARKLVDDKYRNISFPFEAVEEGGATSFEFEIEKVMDLGGFLTYIRSWSAYQTAGKKGVELLRDDVIEKFKGAWFEDGIEHKVVKFPVHLRIGKVGSEE